MKKVIFDTDTFNEADDQFALAYLLKYRDLFDIEAITISPFKHSKYNYPVSYSVDDSFDEISKIFDYLGIEDRSIVYKGSTDYLVNGYDEENPAVKKIIEVCLKNRETYILATGCLTNIALAVKKCPSIIEKMKLIWLGSNFLFGKNQDFNFRQDIVSTKFVFESKVDLTIMPCTPITSNLVVSIYELDAEIKGKNDLCDYLCYIFKNRSHGITKRWPLWDVSVVAYLAHQEWFETMEVSCPYIKEDNCFELTTNRHKIKFIKSLNANAILEDVFSKLRGDEERYIV